MTNTLVVAPIARDAVRVVGPDSAHFLQGQLSQEIEGLAVGESTWSFVLQPQGKVDAWVGVTRRSADEFVLDVEAGFGEALLARLERFKLRVAVDQALVADVRARAWRGPGATTVETDGEPQQYRRSVGWPGIEGVDIVTLGGPGREQAPGPDGADIESVDPLGYEVLRIEHGVPAMGREITDKTIPAELGQWVIDSSVSFTKGCFTGQELVARIDSRGGNVPRHLRVVAIESDDVPPVGSSFTVGGQAAGTLTSVAASPEHGGAVGLAFVPRSVGLPADGEVTWEGRSAPAHVAG